MTPFIVKYYDLSIDDTKPIKKRNVLAVDEILDFVELVARESSYTWSILESERIEGSLGCMDTNDWLKVALQTDGKDHFQNVQLRFIVLTRMKDDPCKELVDHYSLLGTVGPHFSYVTTYKLWLYLLYYPWVGRIALTWLSYRYCCFCCDKSWTPLDYLLKTYNVTYKVVESNSYENRT